MANWNGTHDAYGEGQTSNKLNGNVESYRPKYLGAYHMIGDEAYEPQRSNNFEIRIYGFGENELKTVDEGLNISYDEAQDCLTFSVQSVGGIGTQLSVLEIPYGNTKVKYAGLPSFSDVEVVYNDYIGKGTERVIAAWHKLAFDAKRETIGRASSYKKTGVLIETAPDGTEAKVWNLYGVWPSNVQYGGYDYNANDVRKINMTLTIDKAVPMD